MARPRKPNVERYPNGDIKEEILPPPFNMAGIAEKEIVHGGKILQLRKRVSELERLFDEGRIREYQRLAGEWYASLIRRYRIFIGAPSAVAKVSQPEGPQGGTPIDPDLLEIELQKALQEDYEKLWREYDKVFVLLVDRFNGISIKRAVDSLCLDDVLNNLELAREGLYLIAKHRGMVPRRP